MLNNDLNTFLETKNKDFNYKIKHILKNTFKIHIPEQYFNIIMIIVNTTKLKNTLRKL